MHKNRKPTIILLFLICAVVISLVLNLTSFKSDKTNRQSNMQLPTQITTELSDITVTENYIVNTTCDAPYAIFYNVTDDSILFKKDIHQHIHPASLTKLLTACVALKYVSSDTVFSVGSEMSLVPKGSSLCLISQGHKLTLYDLLTGMLLASGNDASYTIAVNVSRHINPQLNMSDTEAVDYFVTLMNDFAAEIKMQESNFCNPCGWDDVEQFTTIFDLLTLSKFALNISEVKSIVSCSKKYVLFVSGESITWTNTNNLLNPKSEFYCQDAIGMKTGTTNGAGRCLIGAFSNNNKTYIAIVSGCTDDNQRYASLLQLYKDIIK